MPVTDNFFATLNSAVFSDGSFVYVPPGVRCPMELSTYFRINERNTGQFERTLIIADKGSYVSYLEGCTAPQRDENQLHAAVVELVALDDAEIKYSTVQNWYPGDAEGRGGIYNFVTKRGDCRGKNAIITWTQVETGSAITWKYPSCILRGDGSRGEFYSIAISNGRQQVDSGTKMIHLGKNTTSRVISKGIAAGRSDNTYRGLDLGPSQGDAARATSRTATRSSSATNAAPTRCPTSSRRTPPPCSSTRRPPRRSPRTSSSTACQRGLDRRGGDGAHRQWLRQGRAAEAADGIRRRGPEADRDLARGKRRVAVVPCDAAARISAAQPRDRHRRHEVRLSASHRGRDWPT